MCEGEFGKCARLANVCKCGMLPWGFDLPLQPVALLKAVLCLSLFRFAAFVLELFSWLFCKLTSRRRRRSAEERSWNGGRTLQMPAANTRCPSNRSDGRVCLEWGYVVCRTQTESVLWSIFATEKLAASCRAETRRSCHSTCCLTRHSRWSPR